VRSALTRNPLIIDTDVGTDDLLALAYLLSTPEVLIEAITVVHGMADVRQGAHNVRRLLELAGRSDIPVFEGEERPLEGHRPFPAEWRAMANTLPGVTLPEVQNPRNSRTDDNALQFLMRRLNEHERPVRILALGPLTHVALVLRDLPEASSSIADLVIMGGAVGVEGNLSPGNPEKPANKVAEWNIYCDPHAANAVLKSHIPTLLIPLDATVHVPITRRFIEEFRARHLTSLGRLVSQILQAALPYVDQHAYFTWDPLAAVALRDPAVVGTRGGSLEVVTRGNNIGQTRLVEWNSDSTLSIAITADAPRFMSDFAGAFMSRPTLDNPSAEPGATFDRPRSSAPSDGSVS
jgi:pyrimidine-specific ribonucleoside hydrolase